MKYAALIPARLESSRFPGKLLQKIGDKSVIRHVYDNTVATELFELVAVVCNHSSIYEEIVNHGGKAFMSKNLHTNGTDRIAEIAADLDYDFIFNIQGDEPFVNKNTLQQLKNTFVTDLTGMVRIVSPMTKITDSTQIDDPNVVKVVTTTGNHAMYFSRGRIPYQRDKDSTPNYFKHIGIYGFRRKTLLEVTSLLPTPAETTEMIECIRYLEHGIPIKMVQTEPQGVSIDTPFDLEKARSYYDHMLHKQ